MTTKVTVDAHAGWPVKVTKLSLDSEGHQTGQEEVTVAPNTMQDFYIHSHMEIHVKEIQDKP